MAHIVEHPPRPLDAKRWVLDDVFFPPREDLRGPLADEDEEVFVVERLLAEEAVFVLPGACFGAERFFRVVFSGPRESLADAFDRMEAFCNRHAVSAEVV